MAAFWFGSDRPEDEATGAELTTGELIAEGRRMRIADRRGRIARHWSKRTTQQARRYPAGIRDDPFLAILRDEA